MKFWIPSSTWLPSTPKRTWLLSIHTEKTRCIVLYTRQRVHAYHTHWGDEATHAKCWPYGRYQPRHHFRESEFFVLQWTLQHLWLCLVLISVMRTSDRICTTCHPTPSYKKFYICMTEAQQYNICTKQRSVLNWRKLSRPADAPSWDSNPVLVAGKCHVCINPEQETKISFFKLVFKCYDEYLI